MHICVVARQVNAAHGVATHVSGLVRALDEAGQHVTLLATDVRNSRDGRIDTLWVRSFRELRGWMRPFSVVVPWVFMVRLLLRIHRRNPIHVFHVHDGIAFYAVALVAKMYSIPTVYTCHSLSIACPATSPYARRAAKNLWRANRFVARNASAYVCVSKATRDVVRQCLPVPHERLLAVPNCVRLQSVSLPRGGACDMSLCLFVGSLMETKGVVQLIEAMKIVHDQRADASMAIIGAGPEEATVRRLIASIGLDGVVFLTGRLERQRVNEWYRKSALLVLPSWTEALPTVVLEAFAYGVPVVASDVGGVSEVVESGRNGTLVRPRDVPALAAAMLEILDDPKKRSEMSDEARKTVQEFGWEAGAEALLALYSRLTACGGAGARE